MRLVKFAVVAGAATALVVGCTTAGEKGNPTTAAPTTPTAGSSSAGTTTTPASDRPEALTLDGVDPCALIPADKQKQLGTEKTDNRPSEVIKGTKSPACSQRTGPGVLPAFSYNIALVTNEGVGYWTDSGNLDTSPKKVGDYPAVQVTFSGTSSVECTVAVDVADGQQLVAQFLPTSRDFTQDQMCQNAAKGAEVALTTLQTLK
ncbi:DUF3558 domain-containing protein [Actinosynnema sp. NPDC023587]|uniref:DUF3558 domain-containing protein n=1 Tax=Actinosynnema sp. NPDC023587 TaxID=3154695 RepID=UPI0033D884F4